MQNEQSRKRKKRGHRHQLSDQVVMNDAIPRKSDHYSSTADSYHNYNNHALAVQGTTYDNNRAPEAPKKGIRYGGQLSSHNLGLPNVNLSRVQKDANHKQTIGVQLQHPRKSLDTKLPSIQKNNAPTNNKGVPNLSLHEFAVHGVGYNDSTSQTERSAMSNKQYAQTAPNSARAVLQPSNQPYATPPPRHSYEQKSTTYSSSNITASLLKVYKDPNLTGFERTEIVRYSEVYYIGAGAKKIKPDPSQANSAFDDDKGDYKVVLHDHIAYRYEIWA
jgi:hypothetical protein